MDLSSGSQSTGSTLPSAKPGRRALWILGLALLSAALDVAFAQRLPPGQYQPIRERTYDLLHYRGEVHLDFQELRVRGRSTLELRPLAQLDSIVLDAVGLEVSRVTLSGEDRELSFHNDGHTLEIELPRQATPSDTLTLRVTYQCRPRSGMYFYRDPRNPELYLVHTYGEGGLHANWLPIYSGVNDKFTTEMLVTVPRAYTVVSNGTLVESLELPDGQMSYHWRQDRPHSNYLISLYVGDLERGTLATALDSVPVSYWVPRGLLSQGAYAFRNTSRMVEFFSRRFDYDYPWAKYDQIAVPDYAVGAMEHTGVTGHNWSVLRLPDEAPLDFGSPTFDEYTSDWTAEATIAHELAHHWFGNNLTCRSLSYIWLNESFASYLMMLWDEESLGRDQLDFDVDLARRHYLEHVAREHVIRPLEYPYFDSPDEIYNTEHTYLKGAAVLHMLRGILGDAGFFRALSHYLKKHEFDNVVSQDLAVAIQETTGQNLQWFFDQWVTGGGHPRFEVSYRYLADRRLLDLNVRQVQPVVEGQGLFRLPVSVTLATHSRRWEERIWVERATQSYLLSSPQEPRMVSFDGGGSLVAEVSFAKGVEELVYQAREDRLAGRLRALRRLAAQFPRDPETLRTLTDTLEQDRFWGLKAEATLLLGHIPTPGAMAVLERALHHRDYRVRKAAVLALATQSTPPAVQALEGVVDEDSHSDVVATAIVALVKVKPEVEADFFKRQLQRDSWYDEIRLAVLTALESPPRPDLVPTLVPYTGAPYNQDVREAALQAWEAASPQDPELHKRLLGSLETPPYSLRQYAIESLGRLYVAAAVAPLEEIVESDFDPNLTVLARHALEQIRRIEGAVP